MNEGTTWAQGFPPIHPRTHIVNEFRNELERMILHHPKITELTCAELAYLLSELAFRWSIQALRAEREDPKAGTDSVQCGIAPTEV